MTIIMTMLIDMIMANVNEVKARLSEYLDAMSRGERVLICNRNRPVAELRPVGTQRTAPRPIGGAKDIFTVPPSFFEPLPGDMLGAFEGDALTSPAPSLPRAAERAPRYGNAAKVAAPRKKRR
jgi:prevent-host-death family protein